MGFNSGGASSARDRLGEGNPNQYNLTGGSPLVSRRHGSTSNLHEASPNRLNDGQSYASSSNMRVRRSSANLPQVQATTPDLSPVAVNRGNPRCNRMELEEFIKAIKDIIFAEREVESAKIELALKSDFNIVDAFNQMDRTRSGDISLEDLREGLMSNLYFIDFVNDDMVALFKRFDRRQAGFLNFSDFSRLMLPFSREYAALITDRIDYYSRRTRDGKSFFNSDTRYDMQAFWAVHIRTERMMETLRRRLNSLPYFNIRDIFEHCTRTRNGMILPSDMREVMAENGFYATERELQGLMYRLDRDQDSLINF